MSIRPATAEDIPTIRSIALRTWPVAYGAILAPAQLQYMLELMYNPNALAEQFRTAEHRFAVWEAAGEAEGFAGYEHSHGTAGRTKLHKLYVSPTAQGTGAGRALLRYVIQAAQEVGDVVVQLNVNRFNRARTFYERNGFVVVRDEVIDIGHGYVMDDHVMELMIG